MNNLAAAFLARTCRLGTAWWLRLSLLSCLVPIATAHASPWAEVGDAQLRSDIEILASYRLIDNLVTTWPLPWAQIARALRAPTDNLPAYVKNSLARVRERYEAETAPGPRFQTRAAVTTSPTLVRTFDDRARQEIDARAGMEYVWATTALRLNLGLQSDIDFSDAHPALDGSYAAQELGNWLIYGGYLDQWWAGGWVGNLIFSNNARPFPRVGIMRNDPKPFETPWLSWIGPWQVNGFVGLLEDKFQAHPDPYIIGLRASFSPLPWVEIGASRAIQICGSDRPCDGRTWWRALTGNDNDVSPDPSNQLGGFDARFSTRIGDYPVSLYAQYIGEDEAGGLPSKSAAIVGASVAGPIANGGARWRVVAEYADTAASVLNASPAYNILYEHSAYTTGFRYRGRSIGHTLDNDAKLTSVLLSLTDTRDWTYRLGYHHARLNRDDVPAGNRVSATAETINLVELGLDLPWDRSTLSFSLRFQDDQPDTPNEKDSLFAAEAGWNYRW